MTAPKGTAALLPAGEFRPAQGTSGSLTGERIRRAAEETLERWPAAQAVLLFGSRARGDHDEFSDWDLAVVTDGSPDHPPELPIFGMAVERLDIVILSADEIRRHRNDLAHLGCALSRYAVTLAGTWRRPTGLKEPELNFDSYLTEIENSQAHIADALNQMRTGLLEPARARAAAGRFVSGTADAAEHLVKAILLRRGIEPQKTHRLHELADMVSQRDPGLAERVRELNGDTAADHVAHYGTSPASSPDSVGRSITRLHRTANLLAEEIPHFHGLSSSTAFDTMSEAAELLAGVNSLASDPRAVPAALQSANAFKQGQEAVIAAVADLRSRWDAANRQERDADPGGGAEEVPEDGGPSFGM